MRGLVDGHIGMQHPGLSCGLFLEPLGCPRPVLQVLCRWHDDQDPQRTDVSLKWWAELRWGSNRDDLVQSPAVPCGLRLGPLGSDRALQRQLRGRHGHQEPDGADTGLKWWNGLHRKGIRRAALRTESLPGGLQLAGLDQLDSLHRHLQPSASHADADTEGADRRRLWRSSLHWRQRRQAGLQHNSLPSGLRPEFVVRVGRVLSQLWDRRETGQSPRQADRASQWRQTL